MRDEFFAEIEQVIVENNPQLKQIEDKIESLKEKIQELESKKLEVGAPVQEILECARKIAASLEAVEEDIDVEGVVKNTLNKKYPQFFVTDTRRKRRGEIDPENVTSIGSDALRNVILSHLDREGKTFKQLFSEISDSDYSEQYVKIVLGNMVQSHIVKKESSSENGKTKLYSLGDKFGCV